MELLDEPRQRSARYASPCLPPPYLARVRGGRRQAVPPGVADPRRSPGISRAVCRPASRARQGRCPRAVLRDAGRGPVALCSPKEFHGAHGCGPPKVPARSRAEHSFRRTGSSTRGGRSPSAARFFSVTQVVRRIQPRNHGRPLSRVRGASAASSRTSGERDPRSLGPYLALRICGLRIDCRCMGGTPATVPRYACPASSPARPRRSPPSRGRRILQEGFADAIGCTGRTSGPSSAAR
jgi:hypothetical protein